MRILADRVAKALCQLVLRVFFREIEVLDREAVPCRGGVIFVANHVNGLVDPLLLLGTLPRHPRFLGKSTLWEMVVLRPFLALGGVIPVYRQKDPGVDTARNVETFARCREVLAAGGSIALFPEGLTHSEPSLQPLRTGAARIALETLEQHPDVEVSLVPVGLVFESKEEFRSRALVQVGEPIEPGSDATTETPPSDEERRQGVRRLTERVETGLRRVTLNYASWEEARLLEQAADIYLSSLASEEERDLTRPRDLARKVDVRRAFVDAYPEMQEAYPDRVAEVARRVEEYVGLLDLLGLEHGEVRTSFPPRTVLLFVARALGVLLLALPVAVLGMLLNWLPYRIPGWIAAALADSPEVRATFKVYSGIVLFPLFWALEVVLAAWLWGAWGGLATALLAPLSGWMALRFNERRTEIWQKTRAFLLLTTRRRRAEEVRRTRQRVEESVAELAGLSRSPPL